MTEAKRPDRSIRRRALLVCCALGCMPVALGQQTRVDVPEIQVTGNRLPVPIQTNEIQVTGNRAPVPIQTMEIRATGNRLPQPIMTAPIIVTGNRGIEEP